MTFEMLKVSTCISNKKGYNSVWDINLTRILEHYLFLIWHLPCILNHEMWGNHFFSFLHFLCAFFGCSHIELKLLDDAMLATSICAFQFHSNSCWFTVKVRDSEHRRTLQLTWALYSCHGFHIQDTGLTN